MITYSKLSQVILQTLYFQPKKVIFQVCCTILCNVREKYNKDIRKAKNVQIHVTTMLQLIPCTTPNKSLSHIPTKNGEGSRLWKMTVGPKNVYRAACNHQTEGSANGKYYSIWDVPAMHLKKTQKSRKKNLHNHD